MKKTVLIVAVLVMLLGALLSPVIGSWWLDLPFVPDEWRNRLRLNANILPASDDSRALLVAVNPQFRAEFGDRENPTNAWLRLEVKERTEKEEKDNADVNPNLLDTLLVAGAGENYNAGIEWQLFSVGIDEEEMLAATDLAADEEMLRLTKEILGENLIATTESDLQKTMSQKQNVQTETKSSRQQGYDVVENLAVAEAVDLQYRIVPGKGIASTLVIGDREGFDTACLQLLSVTGTPLDCDLPSNRFSFLLSLDAGQQLKHSPLAIDGGENGTDYIVDEAGRWLWRLINPTLIDSKGQKSQALKYEVRRGEVEGVEMDNFYIVTITADLGWLLDKTRVFPVKLESGFLLDKGELFIGEQLEN